MKMRNKGKVFPSPSSSSSSCSPSPARDILSVLKLLPAAILTIASVLSLQDRQVLAYLMTRSIIQQQQQQSTKTKKIHSSINTPHNPPLFHCDCFDCYRSYWTRWDSSPNRELIHQAIEAFDEHLGSADLSASADRSNNSTNARATKKRDKMSRRSNNRPAPDLPPLPEKDSDLPLEGILGNEVLLLPGEADVAPPASAVVPWSEENVAPVLVTGPTVVLRSTTAVNDKGLARKVLPDVMGLFSSRLWSLWSPNV